MRRWKDNTGGSYPTYDSGCRDYTGTGRGNSSWGSRDEGSSKDTDKTIYVPTNR